MRWSHTASPTNGRRPGCIQMWCGDESSAFEECISPPRSLLKSIRQRPAWVYCPDSLLTTALSLHLAVEAPVVGMNVQQLKAVFLHDFDRSRLKFSSRVALKKWEIFCIPAIPIPHRLPAWLARVMLLTELEDGRKLSSGFHVYRYQQEFFTWHLISDSTAGTAFEAPFVGLLSD